MLDSLIQSSRLYAFIDDMVDTINDEQIFDIWLHKVYDKSLADFKRKVKTSAAPNTSGKQESTENVLKNTFDILKDFSPN